MLKEILAKLGWHKDKPLNINQVAKVVEEAKKEDMLEQAKKKDKVKPTVVDPMIVARDLTRVINHYIPDFGRWRAVKTLMKLRVNGAPINEVAFAFNVPEATVMSLEQLGKDKIKKGMSKDPEYFVPGPGFNSKSRIVFPT